MHSVPKVYNIYLPACRNEATMNTILSVELES